MTGQTVLCPNSPFPLILSEELIPAFLEQINEGIRALPRVRPEVGGLLVGPKSQAGQFLVDEVVPVSIEYRLGPSFRLSPLDLDNLALAVGSAQKDSGRAVMGFYRSRTRGDAKLRESDWEILGAIKQAHPSYAVDFRFFLVLTPISKSAIATGAVTRNGGGWEEMQFFTLRAHPPSVTAGAPEPEPLEGPYIDAPPAAASVETPAPTSLPAVAPAADPAVAAPARVPPSPQPKMAASARFPESSQPPSLLKSAWWRTNPIWMSIIVLAAAAAGYVFSTARSNRPAALQAGRSLAPAARTAASPAASKSPLALTAERRGADLALSWDHEAPAVVNATFGMLLIRGAGVSRDIPLSPEQLRSGAVLYTPTTDQVEIQLNVVSGNQATHDSLIALLPPKGDAHPVVATAQTIETRQPAPAAPVEHPSQKAPSPPPKAFSPPPTSPPSTDPALSSINSINESAPAVPPIPPSAAEGAPLVNQLMPASTVAVPTPAPTAPVAPATAGPPSTIPPSVPAIAAAAPPTASGPATQTPPSPQPTVQATPIFRVVPRFPDALHSILTKQKTVQVRVFIDASGKPVNAEALPQPDSYKALDEAARAAVMQWKFQPAKIGNRSVASSLVLEFSFSPAH
jgi:periplasmic protein TonB